jgi:predicted short-subunit dehydrogenase-like oxidoreductase (DUF2520 family)
VRLRGPSRGRAAGGSGAAGAGGSRDGSQRLTSHGEYAELAAALRERRRRRGGVVARRVDVTTANPESASPIGIAGAGRVARAFGRLLVENGEPLACIASRTPESAHAAAKFIGGGVRPVSYAELRGVSHALVCVSDSAIEGVAGQLAGAEGVFLHTCGAKGPEALRPIGPGAACGAIHPLQTFPELCGGSGPLTGIAFAVSGDAAAMEWAERFVALARGNALRIPDDARPLYHAAAVMASNYVVALLAAAEAALIAAGVDRGQALAALGPIVRASVENTLRQGPAAALTGPVQRGDAATVEAHLAALRRGPSGVGALYRACGLAALDLTKQRGLAPEAAQAIERALQTELTQS